MESLEASRTGSQRLVFDDVRDADEAMSVYARDPEVATAVLGRATRDVLLRALTGRNASPVLVVGSQHLMVTAEGREPLPFEALEGWASDLLTLYAMLASPSSDA